VTNDKFVKTQFIASLRLGIILASACVEVPFIVP